MKEIQLRPTQLRPASHSIRPSEGKVCHPGAGASLEKLGSRSRRQLTSSRTPSWVGPLPVFREPQVCVLIRCVTFPEEMGTNISLPHMRPRGQSKQLFQPLLRDAVSLHTTHRRSYQCKDLHWCMSGDSQNHTAGIPCSTCGQLHTYPPACPFATFKKDNLYSSGEGPPKT